MTYSTYYRGIFLSVRNAIYVKLTEYAEFLTICKTANHHCTFEYISIVANALTAYNELRQFDKFVKIRHFYT